MNNKSNLSRITIDVTKEQHRKLKTKAAILGKSIRELVIEALNAYQECAYDHEPNEETIKILQNIEENKNLVNVESIDEFIKNLD